MQLMISEILEKVEKETDPRNKINLLRSNYTPALEHCLQGAFEAGIEWILPPGKAPYKPDDSPAGLAANTLFAETKKFRYFVRVNGQVIEPDLPKLKREQMFIHILESVHSKEAELLCAIKDKSLQALYPSVTPQLVGAAFPGMIKNPINAVELAQPTKIEDQQPPKRGRGRPKGTTKKKGDAPTDDEV